MAFVKGAWRILVAIKDGLVLLFLLLFFGALYTALSYSPKPAKSVNTGALLLELNGTVVEQPAEISPTALLSGGAPEAREYRLSDIVTALEAAKGDAKVKAVVLNLDGFLGGGQVALGRIGAALDAVRAAKKPVLAYATLYSDDSYQLAAHASEVWTDPLGGVAIMGRGGSNLYYKGLIDKLGVNTHVYRVGTYKSFVEPFIRTEQSPEARQANQALAEALWQQWQDDVAKARPRARIAAYAGDPAAAARAANGDIAKAALSAGLVDKLGDATAFADHVADIAGDSAAGDATGFAAIDLRTYVKARAPANNGQIGVLTVAGDIVDGEAGPGTAAGDTISDLLLTALDQRNGLDPAQWSQLHADAVFLLLGLTVGLVVTLLVQRAPRPAVQAALVLLGIELGQGVIGFVQYFNDLPELLVGLHMLGAAILSALTTAALLRVRHPEA